MCWDLPAVSDLELSVYSKGTYVLQLVAAGREVMGPGWHWWKSNGTVWRVKTTHLFDTGTERRARRAGERSLSFLIAGMTLGL